MLEKLARLLPWRGDGVRERKAAGNTYFAFEGLAKPAWSPRDYGAFAREGMMRNAIVYRSIRMISEAAASVPLIAYQENQQMDEHPLLDLLAGSGSGHTAFDLFEIIYGHLLVSGNAYIDAVAIANEIAGLHVLRPDRMRVMAGSDGWPEAFEYTAGQSKTIIRGEAVTNVPRILHMKLFHPTSDHYGLSPLEASAAAIDVHNTAGRWNKALLDNSARPSGALVYTADGHLTGEQFNRLKGELDESFQGARNAGRPLLLEGGLDWKAMSLTPRDMDFIEAKNAAAREIALALGVPPMLLGIPGDNTYSNYQEANRTFWRQTVLPLVQRTVRSMSRWLSPAWESEVMLKPDLNAIQALAPEREALWLRLEQSSFLSLNEKRSAVGYGAVDGGDVV